MASRCPGTSATAAHLAPSIVVGKILTMQVIETLSVEEAAAALGLRPAEIRMRIKSGALAAALYLPWPARPMRSRRPADDLSVLGGPLFRREPGEVRRRQVGFAASPPVDQRGGHHCEVGGGVDARQPA